MWQSRVNKRMGDVRAGGRGRQEASHSGPQRGAGFHSKCRGTSLVGEAIFPSRCVQDGQCGSGVER